MTETVQRHFLAWATLILEETDPWITKRAYIVLTSRFSGNFRGVKSRIRLSQSTMSRSANGIQEWMALNISNRITLPDSRRFSCTSAEWFYIFSTSDFPRMISSSGDERSSVRMMHRRRVSVKNKILGGNQWDIKNSFVNKMKILFVSFVLICFIFTHYKYLFIVCYFIKFSCLFTNRIWFVIDKN